MRKNINIHNLRQHKSKYIKVNLTLSGTLDAGIKALTNKISFFERISPKIRGEKYSHIIEKNKKEWLNFCVLNTANMKNIPLPLIPKKSQYQAVIVESRTLSYLEFIIRNTIIMLGSQWSHTIFATLENGDSIKTMVADISPNIQVIILPITSLSINGYNALLTSPLFWQILHGRKILIYQHDAFIFRNGIEKFLIYDYIGAPWSIQYRITATGVGNGGLSLRDRIKMIATTIFYPWENFNEYGVFTKIWMRWKGVNGPEDVYFSKILHQLMGANLPYHNIARQFSVETLDHPDPFGGHQWWVCGHEWRDSIKRNLLKIFKKNQQKMEGL